MVIAALLNISCICSVVFVVLSNTTHKQTGSIHFFKVFGRYNLSYSPVSKKRRAH